MCAIDGVLKQSLMEFPNVPLPTFKPSLEALQKMSMTPNLAFANLLARKQLTKKRKFKYRYMRENEVSNSICLN